MRKLKSFRDTIYNKVFMKPKNYIGSCLRDRCDRIPENRRLTVVTVLLTIFVLVAFFVFGNACYRIGRGQAAAERIEVKHIEGLELPVKGLELPAPDDSDSLMVEYNITDNGFSTAEEENQ